MGYHKTKKRHNFKANSNDTEPEKKDDDMAEADPHCYGYCADAFRLVFCQRFGFSSLMNGNFVVLGIWKPETRTPNYAKWNMNYRKFRMQIKMFYF